MIESSVQELGMQLPAGFNTDMVGDAVGLDQKVHTIDVATQQPGPRLTLGDKSMPRCRCNC